MSKANKVNVHYPSKSISVSGEFSWPSNTTFKIKATYEEWKSWHDIHLQQNCDISIASIFNHISRPKRQDLEILRHYSYDEPCDFLWEFYINYLIPSYRFSPITGKQSRGLCYQLSSNEFRCVIICAKWLYVLLKYWHKLPKNAWPDPITNFVKRHNLHINRKFPISCVLVDALRSLFDINLGEDYENFCHDHVRGEDIKAIRANLKAINYLPLRYPLNILFEDLPSKDLLRKLIS